MVELGLDPLVIDAMLRFRQRAQPHWKISSNFEDYRLLELVTFIGFSLGDINIL